MKKKRLLISSLLMLMGVGMAHAQTAYVYVEQNGSVVEADGIGSVSISDNEYALSFSGDNAVLKVGEVIVATLPVNSTSKGALVCNTELPNSYTTETAVVKADVTTAGMATYYSPFRLSVPTSDDVTAYAPTYNSTGYELECTATTQVNNAIIPAGTALLLQGSTSEAKSITFTIAVTGTEHSKGDLSGSALEITKPTPASGNSIYTLGHKKDDSSEFRFFRNVAENVPFKAAKAWLEAATISADAKNGISLNFEDESTAINAANAEQLTSNNEGKFVENGRVVIIKDSKKYNVNGQEIR